MREITTVTKVYKFEELTKEQQHKAIENYHDINVDHDWWQMAYEDARCNFDIKILGFDLGRGQSIELGPNESYYNTAIQIRKNIGKKDIVIKHANEYLENKDRVQFQVQLEDYFWEMLQKEYEYLISDEAIKETLISNEYEFTEDGKIF